MKSESWRTIYSKSKNISKKYKKLRLNPKKCKESKTNQGEIRNFQEEIKKEKDFSEIQNYQEDKKERFYCL